MTGMLASGVRQEQAAPDAAPKVILGVDDSPGGLAALCRAVGLARSANAPLVAVRVWGLVRQAFRTAVGGIPGDLEVTIETPEGSPGPVLTQLVSDSSDVLVVGATPGHGLKRAMHGSVSAYCSIHLPSQVCVVRAGQPGPEPGPPALAGGEADRPGPVTRAVRW